MPPSDAEQRAARLHSESVVLVCHDHLSRPQDFEAMRLGGVTAKVLHVSVDALIWEEGGRRYQSSLRQASGKGWAKRALVSLETVLGHIEANQDRLCLIRKGEDVLAAKKEGKCGIIVGFEGAKPLEGSLELLHVFHRLGLRVMQLTWAVPNPVVDRRAVEGDLGLTSFGRELIQEMNRLGILIDISHITYLSRKAFFDVLELSGQPVLAGHCTAKAIAPGGELDDEQIVALGEKGGVIGLHFGSHLVRSARRGPSDRQADLQDLVDQAEHIGSLIGIEHVALGCDYFLNDEVYARAQGPGFRWLSGADEISQMPNVTAGLVAAGYGDEGIKGILGGNVLRLLRET